MRFTFAPTVLVLLAACGPAGSITGTVGGKSFAVTDAAAIATVNDANDITGLLLILSSHGGICDDLANGVARADANALRIRLVPSTGALPAGTFEVTTDDATPVPEKAAYAAFSANDATCRNTLVASETKVVAGSVVVSSIDDRISNGHRAGNVRGTFELVVGPGSARVSGTFDAAICPSSLLIENPVCE